VDSSCRQSMQVQAPLVAIGGRSVGGVFGKIAERDRQLDDPVIVLR